MSPLEEATATTSPKSPFLSWNIAGKLQNAATIESDWLWQGFLMPRCITLLTSQWKSGKTTLIATLLHHLQRGGEFLGYPLRAGKSIVITEENLSLWASRVRDLPTLRNAQIISQPFQARPTLEDWDQLEDQLTDHHEREGLDLIVIDSLAALLPVRAENVSACMLEALEPLERLAALNIAILITHHPKKGKTTPGQASRGSGSLPANVDIILEMNWHTNAYDDDRRRRLLGFSRFPETPRRLLIELNSTRTNYINHGDYDDSLAEGWMLMNVILKEARTSLTRREIIDDWPEDAPPPDENTLWRWLKRAVAEGRIEQTGGGRKNNPYRYALRVG